MKHLLAIAIRFCEMMARREDAKRSRRCAVPPDVIAELVRRSGATLPDRREFLPLATPHVISRKVRAVRLTTEGELLFCFSDCAAPQIISRRKTESESATIGSDEVIEILQNDGFLPPAPMALDTDVALLRGIKFQSRRSGRGR